MTDSLSEQLGIAEHELVSLVGAGGKTTLLRDLGVELASAQSKVILTTTTKMAPRQITGRVCWSADASEVDTSLVPGSPLYVMSGRTSRKVRGFSPDEIDVLYRNTSADHILVEADGARSMSIKAPADHEPSIPGATTRAVVVVGADAIGRPLTEVAHRPEVIATLTGCAMDAVVTPGIAAMVLLHPAGGMKGIPIGARVAVAITKVSSGSREEVDRLAAHLANDPRIERVITIPLSRG